MWDKLNEECGVFGVYNNESHDIASITYYALYALQHRGQESCGIAINKDGIIRGHKDLGLVNEVFNQKILDSLGQGKIAIGHCRYATCGQGMRSNAQPLIINHLKGSMALAHNGNLTNAGELRRELELSGAIFQATSDTEVIAYTITKQRLTSQSIEEAISKTMEIIKGAYCLLVMSPKKLIAARDPYGIRPLCIGKLGDTYMVASETCALESNGATFLRDVLPGEIVVIDESGIKSIKTHCTDKCHLCVFEFVYFARPDSVIEGSCVQTARQRAGSYLALEHPVQADVVIGVPDSGLDAALGFSKQSGIPYGVGLLKNKYVGRTFIQPDQLLREKTVRIKLNPIASTLKDKRVVLIDDSIVRGTTSKRIVQLIREAGAKEVHMRISAPPFKYPCYFGTDVDTQENLIAWHLTVEEIAKEINVDSLGYLSVDDVKKIAINSSCDYCVGCFTGEYPMEVPKGSQKHICEIPLGKEVDSNEEF
ncbi:MAG: amidophosphoribosyltransferase [Firmicutes bacterium]|nr:amidophosphoribosyltransferase [Bacillota bacterium]